MSMGLDLRNILNIFHTRNRILEDTKYADYVQSDEQVNKDVIEKINQQIPIEIINDVEGLVRG